MRPLIVSPDRLPLIRRFSPKKSVTPLRWKAGMIEQVSVTIGRPTRRPYDAHMA